MDESVAEAVTEQRYLQNGNLLSDETREQGLNAEAVAL
jgi:hypothetical protein